jgi:hypothetical protein
MPLPPVIDSANEQLANTENSFSNDFLSQF